MVGRIFRDIIYCEKCERTGRLPFLFKTVICVECMGNGYFTIEHLRQVRAGRSVKRLRQRYWLKFGDVSAMFGISVNDWKRIEYGHFEVEYTNDVYEALKRYTDSLEKLTFYTLIRNPKNRRQGFKELYASYNKALIDREIVRLKLKPTDYHIIPEEVYAETFSAG